MPFDELKSDIQKFLSKSRRRSKNGMFLVFAVGERHLAIDFLGTETIREVKRLLVKEYGIHKNSVLLFRAMVCSDSWSLDMIPGISELSEIIVEQPSNDERVGTQRKKEVVVEDKTVSQSSIARLVEMGFSEVSAIKALKQANNDITLAKSLLSASVNMEINVKEAYKKLGPAAKAAIQRLTKTGKDWDVIVCTYLSCHKDEVMAKNILSAGL